MIKVILLLCTLMNNHFDVIQGKNVNSTIYQPQTKQCDESPFETADGSVIDPNKLDNGEIRWIAVSRNIHARWGGRKHFGDKIFVLSSDMNIFGFWEIHDIMNKRFENKIDFLQSEETGFIGAWNNIKILYI